jgi:hypothetical protein
MNGLASRKAVLRSSSPHATEVRWACYVLRAHRQGTFAGLSDPHLRHVEEAVLLNDALASSYHQATAHEFDQDLSRGCREPPASLRCIRLYTPQ